MEKNELEEYILAGLYKETQVPAYIEALTPEMFSKPNQKLFEELVKGTRDIKTLTDRSGVRASRVMDLFIGNAEYHLLSEETVREFKEMVLRDSAEEALKANDWDKLSKLSLEIQNLPKKSPVQLYKEYKEQFRDIANTGLLGMSTKFTRLDQETKGIVPGHIWVCGAYYGQGKTYFAINIINSLIDQGKRVLFISLEMPPEEIIQRFIALRAQLNLIETLADIDIDKGLIRSNEEAKLFKMIEDKNLIIESDVRNTENILGFILREDMKKHIDLVVIDYIQLLAENDRIYEAISQAVQKLQGLAKKLKVAVLMLSQVNNQSQKEGDNRSVDGFKGAGDIGQVANVAIRIERDRDPETNEFGPRFGLRLTKIRHGKPGKIDMVIDFPGGKLREPLPNENIEKPKPKTKYDKLLENFKGGLDFIEEKD